MFHSVFYGGGRLFDLRCGSEPRFFLRVRAGHEHRVGQVPSGGRLDGPEHGDRQDPLAHREVGGCADAAQAEARRVQRVALQSHQHHLRSRLAHQHRVCPRRAYCSAI